jgi:hypothetical protein
MDERKYTEFKIMIEGKEFSEAIGVSDSWGHMVLRRVSKGLFARNYGDVAQLEMEEIPNKSGEIVHIERPPTHIVYGEWHPNHSIIDKILKEGSM